jgi:hypothetical protein
MLKIVLLTLLLFPVAAYSQLPDKGSIADIAGKTRFYLDTEADQAKLIRHELKKSGLKEVTSVNEADFVIEFHILSQKEKPMTGGLFPDSNTVRRGEMNVYYLRDGKKVVVFSDVKEGGSFSRPAASALPRRFLAELKLSSK